MVSKSDSRAYNGPNPEQADAAVGAEAMSSRSKAGENESAEERSGKASAVTDSHSVAQAIATVLETRQVSVYCSSLRSGERPYQEASARHPRDE